MGEKRVKWYDRQRVDLADMNAEQGYTQTRIGNIFARALGDGVISGLQVSDDSEIANQATQNANYDTLLDTLNNQVIQIFNATADNIQHVIVRGRNVGAAGNVTASIVSLSTPSDSTSALSTVVGQVTVASGSFAGAYGEVTFDFSAVAAVADAGSLTVGSYYALTIERDNIVGSIDISYSTANPYSAGFVKEYDGTTYTNRLTWDLYFKIYTDAVQVSTGYAYKQGNPIEMTSAKRKLNLADTSGATNYIYIKYKETETDAELHPRTGVSTYSRVEDDYEFTVKTSATADDDEEMISSTIHSGTFPLTITDRRVLIPARNTLWDIYVNYRMQLVDQTLNTGLSVDDLVYYNTTNSQWEKASFTNLPQAMVSGTTEVTMYGRVDNLTGLTAGSWYYMDNSGNISTTRSTLKVGFALSTTQFIMMMMTDPSTTAIILTNQTMIAGLAVNDCIYYNTTNNQWEKASFTNLPQGIMTDTNSVTLFGQTSNLSGLTAGSQYYMDSNGALTRSITHIHMGYAQATNQMIVDVDITDGVSDILIRKQSELEFYFGTGSDVATGGTGTSGAGWVVTDVAGNETVTIPNDTNIYLKSNPTDGVITHFKYDATNFPYKAYELKTRVKMQTGMHIHGDGIDQTIIVRKSDDNYPMFITDYLDQEVVSGVAGAVFTVADGSNFQAGQTVEHSNDNKFYKVVGVSGNNVTVDRNITGAASDNLSICQDSIETKDFTFDGRCAVDGLGGNRTNQAFNLQYCAHSIFEAKVINCKDADGGGYHGNKLIYKLAIKNIYSCFATNFGGGAHSCDYSTISEIYNCKADDGSSEGKGGGCYDCDYGIISNIYHCISRENGGGCYNCDYGTINGIYDCSTIRSGNYGGGGCKECKHATISNVYNCVSAGRGGGCENCDDSIINGIYNCSAGSYGGGCWGCDRSKISNIYDCIADLKGGGCFGCADSSISDIHGCVATTGGALSEGGACADCSNCLFTGIFTGNLADTNDTLENCTTSCGRFIVDGAVEEEAALATLDVD